MMGTAVSLFKPLAERTFEFVVFDQDVALVTRRTIGGQRPGSFGGGYFFLNSDDNAVVNDNDHA
jgi:hypothetical protein